MDFISYNIDSLAMYRASEEGKLNNLFRQLVRAIISIYIYTPHKVGCSQENLETGIEIQGIFLLACLFFLVFNQLLMFIIDLYLVKSLKFLYNYYVN